MNRRKALMIGIGAMAGGGALSAMALTTAFKPQIPPVLKPEKLPIKTGEAAWAYSKLEPRKAADIAYRLYGEGSCMYAVFGAVIQQLAEKIGEPFTSFPLHMMKYGHGGVGGYGTVCGALNAGAALMGLFVDEKNTQDCLIESLFRWYEETQLPQYVPEKPDLDFTPPPCLPGQSLCHISVTNWCNASGHGSGSKERKERCRRLSADVAAQSTVILNEFFDGVFTANAFSNATVHTCSTCHGQEGKVANTFAKMDCEDCHAESIGHALFADIHYKIMD